jgi:hypothetical protein
LQAPLTQLVPPVHLMPQPPQLSLSETVLTQDPPHVVTPEQVGTHPPALHD